MCSKTRIFCIGLILLLSLVVFFFFLHPESVLTAAFLFLAKEKIYMATKKVRLFHSSWVLVSSKPPSGFSRAYKPDVWTVWSLPIILSWLYVIWLQSTLVHTSSCSSGIEDCSSSGTRMSHAGQRKVLSCWLQRLKMPFDCTNYLRMSLCSHRVTVPPSQHQGYIYMIYRSPASPLQLVSFCIHSHYTSTAQTLRKKSVGVIYMSCDLYSVGLYLTFHFFVGVFQDAFDDRNCNI